MLDTIKEIGFEWDLAFCKLLLLTSLIDRVFTEDQTAFKANSSHNPYQERYLMMKHSHNPERNDQFEREYQELRQSVSLFNKHAKEVIFGSPERKRTA